MTVETETLTPNMVVSRQLRRVRKERGWTQTQACKFLEPYLGKLWSKQAYCYAERGSRRDWSVNEVVALSQAFGVPVLFFFNVDTEVDQVARQWAAERLRTIADHLEGLSRT
jgi:transcriptional regulator with XRE-family HTH domain